MNNPYKDIASYNFGDSEKFKGREENVKKFSIMLKSEICSVLYSESGIGKTSFINAGIDPLMFNLGFFPIHIVFHDVFKKDQTNMIPIESWLVEYLKNYNNTDEKNKVTNDMLQWIRKPIDYNVNEKQTDIKVKNKMASFSGNLWWLLHTYSLTVGNREMKPFLVFDQFEELFIKARQYDSQQFLRDFFKVMEEVSSYSIPNSINSVLDVLAEEGIFLDIENDVNYRIAFSLRKEYLSDFDYWTNDQYAITELYKNRMILLPMNEEQATRVITEQPLLDEKDKIIEGELTTTLNSVKDYILKKLDDRRHKEIEPFFLSLLCSRLFDTAKTNDQEELSPSDVDKVDMKTILKDFYEGKVKEIFKDHVKDLEAFEDLIIDEEGYRRRIKTTKFPIIDFSSYKKDLVDNHIVRIGKYSEDVEYVELVHDMLAIIINERKNNRNKIYEARKMNHRRVQDDLNVLTIRGRRLLDNTLDFGSFINQSPFNESPFSEDSLVFAGDYILDFNFRYHHHKSINNNFSRFLYEISGREDNYTYFEFRNQKNESVKSIDGVNKFRIRVVKTKDAQGIDKETKNEFGDAIFSQQSVLFLNKAEEPFYIKGFCGVNSYFDKQKREVCREYIDEYGKRVCNIDGYSMVRRIYDEEGNIRSTRYYDSQKEPCPHRNGNFGYDSTFDGIGRETIRFFVDEKGGKTKIASNIWGRLFVYLGDSYYIEKEFNLDETGNKLKDKDGYCGVEFKYDELSRIVCETYLDENETPMIGKDGYSITTTDYKRIGNNQIEVTETYLDTNGENILHKDGFYKVRFTYEDDIRLIKYEYLDTYGRLMNSINSSFSTLLISWNDNYQIQKCIIFDNQGGIRSSKWFLMDERNQFIKQSGDLKENGEKKKDDDGGYGQQFIRDAKSLMPIGFYNININGQVSPADNGILEHRIEYKDGHMSQRLFYDSEGNPKEDEKGAFGYYYEYDGVGNCIKEGVLDSAGNPNENKYGYAYTKYMWGETHKLILSKTYNINGMPFYDESGDYATKYEYMDTPSMIRITSLTENDSPHNNKLGYCTEVRTLDYLNRIVLQQFFDEQGHFVLFTDDNIFSESETIYFDGENDNLWKKVISRNLNKQGELVCSNGFAYKEMSYDSSGRIIEMKQYDDKELLLPDGAGDFITRIEYVDENSMRILSLDKDGFLHLNNDGYAISIRTLDDLGREIKRVYLDCQQMPTPNNSGSWGYNIIYSDDPSIEVIVELDPDGNPLSAVRKIRDEKGLVVSEYYLDSKLEAVCRDGAYGQSYSYDDLLNLRITTRLDENHEPCNNENGWTYEFIYFDVGSDKRPLKIQWYKKDKTPFIDENGDSGIGVDYLEGNKRKQISLDENGMPHTNIHNYSYRIIEEDTKGRTIFEMWYNENNIPVLNNMEDSGVAFEYNDEERILTTKYLDQEGMPHINKSGRSMIRRRSDMNGKYIEEMWLDENGLPIADKKSGCFGIGSFYVDDDFEITINLDRTASPCEDKDGVAFLRRWKNSNGNPVKIMYYDINDNHSQNIAGNYGEKFIYTDDPNTHIRVYLDVNGNPCKNKIGFMREIIISSDKRTDYKLLNENWKSIPKFWVVLKALYILFFFNKKNENVSNHNMPIFQVVMDGQLKDKEIEGCFILMKYNRWVKGFPIEILRQEIENSRETEKDMVFIRLNTNEDKLSLGEYYHMHFTKELLGAHFESITIPDEVHQEATRIVNNHVDD